MELTRIRPFAHKHCRFKLRSGKEVFGVIWEVEGLEKRSLFFASIGDYERLQRDPNKPVSVINLRPEEIKRINDAADLEHLKVGKKIKVAVQKS